MAHAGTGAPVEFSHKRHAALKLPCANCHAGALAAKQAGFPAASKCKSCHVEGAVSQLDATLVVKPAAKTYQVADFVWFRHSNHQKAACATCHGEVNALDQIVERHRPLTMKACVDCHREQKAENACTVCHELGQ